MHTCNLSELPALFCCIQPQGIFLQDYITRTLKANEEKFTDSNHVVLLFSSEKCAVSTPAKQLMELVHQTLKVSERNLNCAFARLCFSFHFALELHLGPS